MKKETMLADLIRRAYTYKKLSNVGFVPDELMNDVKGLFDSTLKQLRDVDIDGEAYLQSIAGQEVMHMYEQKMKVYDASNERCGRCLHYAMIDTNDDDNTYTCEKGVDGTPETCMLYEDSGQNFEVRLQNSLYRCSKCQHCKHTEVQEADYNLDHQSCIKKLNKLTASCTSYKEIT